MIKKIFTNKIYFLVLLLGLFLFLLLLTSLVSNNKNNTVSQTLNPFAQNLNNNVNNETLNNIEDPVLVFFLDQNKKLKEEMSLVDQIDPDIPFPQITWKVNFK